MKNIWHKIAEKLGIQLVDKTRALALAESYSDMDNINITALVSKVISVLSTQDCKISVVGTNKRADYLESILQDFINKLLSIWVEVMLGTGDCLVKPNVYGSIIDFDIVPNNNFYITENYGDVIKGCLIKCDETLINKIKYERVEYHKLEDNNIYIITQLVYKDGQLSSLSAVPKWSTIQEVQAIGGVDRMLFARGKCPTVDRTNINNPNGIPVTTGLSELMKHAIEHINGFHYEYRAKKAKILADKHLLKADEQTGAYDIGDMQDIFVKLNMAKNIESSPIEIYSPDIRDESLTTGITTAFSLIELFGGFNAGILTKLITNNATAEEIRDAKLKNWATITKIHKIIEQGITDLMTACNVISNANNITPSGNYELKFDFDYTYIESTTSRFHQLVQSFSVGAISKAELRSWVMNEDIELAQTEVDKIKESEPKVQDLI